MEIYHDWNYGDMVWRLDWIQIPWKKPAKILSISVKKMRGTLIKM